MKLILFIILGLVSCSTAKNDNIGKPLAKQIPSADKNKLEGQSLNSKILSRIDDTSVSKNYSLLERLFNTAWYQSEKDYDDGKLEIETEFVVFNDKSYVVEREVENGILEAIEADDFARLDWITDVPLKGEVLDADKQTASRNAMIVKTTTRDRGIEIEYEGYWLQEEPTNKELGKILYIVEGDTLAEAERLLKLVINSPSLAEYTDTEKYILSVK